jgi:hypothetical protein
MIGWTSNRRENIIKFVPFLAACAVITIALRLTSCSYGDINQPLTDTHNSRTLETERDVENAENAFAETSQTTKPLIHTSEIEQNETSPICKININLDDIFPKQTKIWIQIGTWLNPITPPPDVGMIGFEPEMATVSQLIPKRPENVYFVPAAVSNQGGIAVFGSEINSGQSSSLNVSANSRLHARRSGASSLLSSNNSTPC